MKAFLAGNAFNTRPCGVVENGYCLLLPRMFSMEQLGYANSELAIPRIGPVLRLLKRYPVDLIEFETPSPGAWLVCFCAKVAGIKVFSHYRTDVPTYTKTLVKAKWMYTYVLWLMQIFYGMTKPVVSPCKDYADILTSQLKIPENQVKILPRGLPLEKFSPDMRGKGTWEKYSEGNTRKVRFSFIGRISKEKNLEFLNRVWKKFAEQHDDVELMYVGYGWYLEEIKKRFKDNPSVQEVLRRRQQCPLRRRARRRDSRRPLRRFRLLLVPKHHRYLRKRSGRSHVHRNTRPGQRLRWPPRHRNG